MSTNDSLRQLFHFSSVGASHTQAVPGKLFISGEYAILYPKQPAILIAVDQYLTAQINPSKQDNKSTISSELISLNSLEFSSLNQLLTGDKTQVQGWQYVIQSLLVCNNLLSELGLAFIHFDLHFRTDLISESGLKFGLGSSGAVTVACIRTILAYHGIHAINNETIYRLASIALLKGGSKGSLGDIAAITHGSWVYYQSFDRQWLKNKLDKTISITELLTLDWPDLVIETLTVPNNLDLKIGWTQTPASTENLVGKLIQQHPENNSFFQDFLREASDSVHRLKQAFQDRKTELIQDEIRFYRQLLLKLNQSYQLNIETPDLTELIEIAENHQYAAKSSGAGGGDCGIAIARNAEYALKLQAAWLANDIVPLDLNASAIIQENYGGNHV